MQENDKEILKKQKEEQKKLMEDLVSKLRSQNLFNMGDNRIEVRENAVGENTIYLAPGIDLNNLPDGWKYEANYQLDSDYAKEGLWRMKDGKYEFLPIGHDMDKSRVVKYSSPEDMINAILAENPHIDKDQMYYDRNGNTIKMVGVLNDIKMPQGLEMRDGMLVDINDPYGKPYEIQKSLANDTTKSDMQAGTKDFNDYGVKQNIGQNPYQEDILSQYKTPTSAGATIEQYGMQLFDFRRMKYVQENYMKNDRGEVISKNKDDSYKSFNTKDENDPLIEATLELNEVWGNAYTIVAGKAGKEGNSADRAFEGEATGELFQNMLISVQQSPNRDLSAVLLYLCQNDNELLAHTGFLKVVGVFLSDQRVANALGIERVNGASIDAIIAGVDHMANEQLKESFDDMMDSLDPVMEMNKKKY